MTAYQVTVTHRKRWARDQIPCRDRAHAEAVFRERVENPEIYDRIVSIERVDDNYVMCIEGVRVNKG